MIYYKVKKEYDQKSKNERIMDGSIYIADEIYTAGEVKRQGLNLKYMDKVEIKKTDTFWAFGARFVNPLA